MYSKQALIQDPAAMYIRIFKLGDYSVQAAIGSCVSSLRLGSKR